MLWIGSRHREISWEKGILAALDADVFGRPLR